MADYVFTVPATLNYAIQLFKPSENGKYGCDLLWDKKNPGMRDELTRFGEYMHDVYRDACTKPSGRSGIPFEGLDPNDPKWESLVPLPMKDGDRATFGPQSSHAGQTRAEVYPEYKGRLFMSVTADYNLLTGEPTGGPIALRDDTTDGQTLQSAFYSGCEVRAKIWVRAFNYRNRRGYSARLVALVKTGAGEPLYDQTHSDDPFAGMGDPPSAASGPFAGMGV